ncbi:MAG: threonine/serine dehydratase [Anaerolineae bacterium]|jgi:threonine dehydratase
MSELELAHVLAARRAIQDDIWRTPLQPSAALNRLIGGDIHLKLECWQRTGSFKVRGALNKLAALSPPEWARGVVTASAGNHGLGVAYASQALGRTTSVVIFVPENAPAVKVERLAAFACEVRRAGADYDTTHATAQAYAQEQDTAYISAYDDPDIIAGQGTVGLEVMEDLPDAELLLVPVGGGGLIAGMAVAAKAINPAVRVVGVQPEASPSAYLSLRDGHAYETYPASPTICDGLAGGFGRLPFEVAGDLIDEVLVVPEADIWQAVAWLLTQEQLVVEGSGAIAIAPLLTGQLNIKGRKVVAVLTGRNLDTDLMHKILMEQNEQ